MEDATAIDTKAPGAATASRPAPLLVIALVALSLFTLRQLAPPNLLDHDQTNPAIYVLDVVKNGNWVCQRDLSGDIASKPPLYTWVAAIISLAAGKVGYFSLYLPGALALFATASLIFLAGRKYFGERAAFLAALALLLTPAGLKQMGLARTDGVFALTVTVAALLAWRGWITGRGWTWFWVASACATLTKGPLGLVLASMGLLASIWERRSVDRMPLRGSHWLGIALFAVITLGWTALAYRQMGPALLDKLLLRELVFHAVEGEHKKLPGSAFYLSPLYYLARGGPWSLLAYVGLWRVWRSPAWEPMPRRFERFLFCWFAGSLFLFSMSPHQRGDLLWPLMPAGALLAGREIDRLTAGLRRARLTFMLAVCVLSAIAGFAAYYFVLRGRSEIVRQTVALQALAGQIQRRGRGEFPLTHTDDAAGLQVILNTYRPPVSFEQAAELLRGPEAAFVCVNNVAALEAHRRAADQPWHTVLDDGGPMAKLRVRIVSNRGQLGTNASEALAMGPWAVRYQGRLIEAHAGELAFDVTGAPGEATVANTGKEPATIRLRISDGEHQLIHSQMIPPGESARVPLQTGSP